MRPWLSMLPLLLAACCSRPPTPPASSDLRVPPGRYLAVPGGGLHVNVHGGGAGKPIVVLVHGWARDASVYYQQVAALIDRYVVVTYDLRGHGDSHDAAHLGGDLALHAADLTALLAGVGQPVHLVGHDLGALIALRVAIDHPATVLSLTLLSPALEPDQRIRRAYLQLAADFQADPTSYRSWAALVAAWVDGAYLEAHPEVVSFFDAMIDRHDHRSVVGTLTKTLDARFTDAELALLKAPTQVLYGTGEAWPSALASEKRLAELPGVTALRVAGVHETYLEAAEIVNRALIDHMQLHPQAARSHLHARIPR